MKRLYLALALLGASCASFALPERALAVATTKVTLNNATWTDLGVGPLLLNGGGTQVVYAIADTTPALAAQGFALPTDKNETVNTASHVWAMAATPYAAFVYVSPVAGTSGSGGTFTWPGSATVTTYGVAPTGTVPAVNTFCTNCAAAGGTAPWSPDRSYSTPLSVTNVSSSTPLPASAVTGSIIKVYNRGPNPAFWTLGAAPTATTSMAQIAPQSWDYATVKAGDVAVAAIVTLSSQSALLNIESGAGSPNGTGGPINPAVLASGNTASFAEVVGGVDNGNHAAFINVSPPGTASTLGLVGIQGSPTGVPVPVSGLAVGGFLPTTTNTRMTPINVGLTDTSGPLPTGSPVEVAVDNTDVANPVYCNVNGVAATLADKKIPANSWFSFTIPAGQTTLHCIAVGGTAIVNGTAGSGLATGAGGGGGGSSGGGGGAVTINAGADVTEGNPTDTAWTGTGNSTVVAALKAVVGGINAGYEAATQSTRTIPASNVTATDCSGTITAGGTAQNAIALQTTLHGFTLANIDASAGSGEPLWMSFTGTAAAATAASYPLPAPTATTFAGMGSYTTPVGLGINHAVSVVGATTGHKFSCTWW